MFFPLKMAFFDNFQWFPFFLPSFFWPPPFSLSLSLSLSFSLLPSFLLVFLFCFLVVSVFVSFSLFLSSLLLFHEKNNIKHFFINPFSFLLLSSLLFSFKSPFLVFAFFLILSFVFRSTSMLSFKNASSKKNTNFWTRGGFQHNFFSTCVLQDVKSYCFLTFLPIFVALREKHYKVGILAHF